MDKRGVIALVVALGVIAIVLVLWLVPVISEDYIDDEPCMVEQTITVKEPKTVTETYVEKEPYNDTETIYVSEAYTDTEKISYSRVSYECHSWGWFSNGCDCNVEIRNNDSSNGGKFYASFGITLNGGATTTIAASEYISPGQTKTITAKYSGSDIESYRPPTITAPTKEVMGTHKVPKTQTVTKYRDVTKTREVTVYEDVEKVEEVMGMCEVEKTRKISVFEHLFD